MIINGTEVEIVTNLYGRSAAPIDEDYEETIPSLLIKGPVNDDIIDYLIKEDVKGLYLNYTKGFTSDSFSFLSKLPHLELLNIINTPTDSLSQVEYLTNLKYLSISCHWKQKINLGHLNRLKHCFISYGKGVESIFKCTSLKYLYFDSFKLEDYEALKELKKLEYLTIGNSTFNQPNLFSNLKELRKLVLLNCRKLDHLKGIGVLKNLEWLTINGSRKLSHIQELEGLQNLSILQLSDNKELESLSPIKNLTQLRALSFFGDTLIKDGDFSFLESFTSLSLLGFANRKHYTHKSSKHWTWDDYSSNDNPIIRK